MATAKKTSAKKTTAKKAPVKKAAVTKKAATKKHAPVRSFRVAADNPSFTTFKISRQTIYWVILVAFIIFMQLWILKLQIEVSNIIEAEISSIESDS
ncbi:MAG: hypothetical protein WAQ27_02275 [Candidatus Microsaccharimonas sp.]